MRPPCLIHLSVIEQNTRCQVFYIGTDTYDATINPNRSHVQHEQRQVFYIGTDTYDATINPNRSHVQHEQRQVFYIGTDTYDATINPTGAMCSTNNGAAQYSRSKQRAEPSGVARRDSSRGRGASIPSLAATRC